MGKRKLLLLAAVAIIVVAAVWPLPEIAPVLYIERDTGALKTETIEGEKWMKWLYYNPLGELSLHALAKRKFVSALYGGLMDKQTSAKKIAPFIDKYKIDIKIAKKQNFTSFNDFFTRELKPGARIIDSDTNVVVSPADGKILVLENLANTNFFVKGNRFDIFSFLQDSVLADRYRQGTLMIIRLAPPDYHRFHFPLKGRVGKPVKIEGDYFSVSPLALRKITRIFCMNKREYVTLATAGFGNVTMAEVGATMVGSIIQTYSGAEAVKGAEKGFFKFGGSTVILLFEKNKITVDNDLLENSANNLETTVEMGARIAMRRM